MPNRLSVEFHNSVASLLPHEVDLLRVARNGSFKDKSPTILIVREEQEPVLILPVQEDCYNPAPLFLTLQDGNGKLSVKLLKHNKKLSCLVIGFADHGINWLKKPRTLSTETNQLIWQIVFSSLKSLAQSKNIDLSICCNIPAEVLSCLSKPDEHCLISSNVFMVGFPTNSSFKKYSQGNTLFAWTNKTINQLMQKKYPLMSS